MKIRQIEKLLREAIKASDMTRAAFDDICSDPRGTPMHNGAPLTEGRVTEFIKARTRLYRETCITARIIWALELIAEVNR